MEVFKSTEQSVTATNENAPPRFEVMGLLLDPVTAYHSDPYFSSLIEVHGGVIDERPRCHLWANLPHGGVIK